MSARLKPFQAATVDAACQTLLQPDGPRRFLVADEVGLGKTVVARDIIQRLAAGRRAPLIVYYITNGQRVAHQNRDRLVDFLPEGERERAISAADRLGLIPLTAKPDAHVALYALTPGTSFPGRTARLHGGRKEERAFIAALLGRAYPRLIRRLPVGVLQGAVRQNWERLVTHHRRQVRDAPRNLVRAFRAALRAELGGEDPRKALPVIAKKLSAGKLAGRLRRALAHAALLSQPPDLVIFDEFQRYRDLLSPTGREDRLLVTLLAEGRGKPPALLMLSATPYKLYASRWEESRGVEAHRELFDLIEFLGGASGHEIRQEAEGAFSRFGDLVRSIARAGGDPEALETLVRDARTEREVLQALLAPLMSRTERHSPRVEDGSDTTALPSAVAPSDVRVYRHLVRSFKSQHRSDALAYWLSVPLPAQALGGRYQAWKLATFGRDGQLVKLTPSVRSRIDPPTEWPHPKMRALKAVTSPESLALPWMAPSQPWWPLSGGWADAHPPAKLLLFSRFKATPQSVAALTSFAVEARYLARDPVGYEKVWRRRRLQAGPGRLPTLALFHPSPFLIEATDPLDCAGGSVRSARSAVRRQLLDALKKLGIEVRKNTAKERERRRPVWSIVSTLDALAGYSARSRLAWNRIGGGDRRLQGLIATWLTPRTLEWISPRELEDLTALAMAGPGVILGRALLRHNPKALEPDVYQKVVHAAWHRLRPYLDNPVFWARLKGGNPVDTVQRATVAGGLEAVLDEHFWLLRQSAASGAAGILGEFTAALGVITGSFGFHPVGPQSKQRIRLRCHAAVPFGGTDEEPDALAGAGVAKPARSDELRKAFNAPFWPYVLATTSVGQEGLDFHTWCSRVAHWDLCSSPLDLEQREGRIQRFGGLVVRRKLAEALGASVLPDARAKHSSPWVMLAKAAESRLSDASGLSPWWLVKGAGVTRYVFELPHGRDALRFERLREQRLIYRLALGQPNQEDFINILASSHPERLAVLQRLTLDLAAFNRHA
ncbi:MAG: helicase [Hyphomicrobiaceae bacterium]